MLQMRNNGLLCLIIIHPPIDSKVLSDKNDFLVHYTLH